jgi:hypothetical protein
LKLRDGEETTMDSNAKLLVLAPLLLLQVLQTLALLMRHARARCTLSNDVIAQATTAPGQRRVRYKVFFLQSTPREIESFDASSLSG